MTLVLLIAVGVHEYAWRLSLRLQSNKAQLGTTFEWTNRIKAFNLVRRSTMLLMAIFLTSQGMSTGTPQRS